MSDYEQSDRCLVIVDGDGVPRACGDEPLSMDLDMVHDEMESLRSTIRDLREGLQTIYRENGEDQRVASICNPLIEKTRYV